MFVLRFSNLIAVVPGTTEVIDNARV